ncbi:uncharacterized protein LOC119569146 [Penaeus monodon]|uniref:uncharacterized protein LOC119569146 n=1 Tax=Penaeus monodon TaxID=6687 RepID=UPI0018A72BBF|nr:uncharacterized protein LOC119569146 [Penaeus monodon]
MLRAYFWPYLFATIVYVISELMLFPHAAATKPVNQLHNRREPAVMARVFLRWFVTPRQSHHDSCEKYLLLPRPDHRGATEGVFHGRRLSQGAGPLGNGKEAIHVGRNRQPNGGRLSAPE